MSRQSRRMSLVESLTNVAVGYGLAVATQMLIFPWFGLPVRLVDNLMIGAIFTVVSICRSYGLRRLFEAIRISQRKPAGARSAAGMGGTPPYGRKPHGRGPGAAGTGNET